MGHWQHFKDRFCHVEMTPFKVKSDITLEKAGLGGLNEMVASTSALMVWKSRMRMDPIGSLLFPKTDTSSALEKVSTRSKDIDKAKLPVPGYGTLAANLLARAWNEAPNLQNASTLGAAKSAAEAWASLNSSSLYSLTDCKSFGFGFGCADGKDRALHASVPFLGFSCSSKGNALLQPSHAGDRKGSYSQFNPNTT